MTDLTYVRLLMKDKSDAEIEERLNRLIAINRGPGHKMYSDLTELLKERRARK